MAGRETMAPSGCGSWAANASGVERPSPAGAWHVRQRERTRQRRRTRQRWRTQQRGRLLWMAHRPGCTW